MLVSKMEGKLMLCEGEYVVKVYDPDTGAIYHTRFCESREEADTVKLRLLEGDKELDEDDIIIE